MNHRWIIVYDLETDGPDPTTANPVEIAAVPVNPRTLEIKMDDTFEVTVKPPGIDKDEYFTNGVQKTIDWHASTRGCSSEDIVSTWKKGKSQKVAMKNFCSYLQKYHIEKDPMRRIYFTEPAYSGYNVDGFDDIIIRNMCDRHKLDYPFAKMGNMDLLHYITYWFENMPEPENYKMDTLKEFFGLQSHGQAHSAISDVVDTAKILVRFLKFARRQVSVDKFKGSFA
jgi:DNA polymerase III epsilon subunit-like protein